jgi:DNA invertase Pin-like site-specific DNA recombinase
MIGILIALYIRVSHWDQDPNSQMNALINWAKNNHYTYELFIDKESGETANRTEFRRLKSKVDAGIIKDVAVWSIDRFFRNTLEGLQWLKDFIEDKNGCLYSVSQGIDSKSIMGKFMICFFLNQAEMELATLRERTSRGIQNKRQENNGKCPWGKRKGTIGAYKLTPQVIKHIKILHDDGQSNSAIAESLCLHRNTVATALKTLN